MLLGSFTLNKAEREKVIQDEEGDTLLFPATIYLSLPPVGGSKSMRRLRKEGDASCTTHGRADTRGTGEREKDRQTRTHTHGYPPHICASLSPNAHPHLLA